MSIFTSLLAFLAARWAEPTTKASVLAGVTAFFGAISAGVDLRTAAIALAVAAVGALVPEAKPVLTDIAAAVTKSTVPLLIAMIMTGAFVTACVNGQLTAGAQNALQVACQIDASVQPVVVTLGPALVPELGPAASVDQTLVHPAVVAACAAYGGKPAAVVPAAK